MGEHRSLSLMFGVYEYEMMVNQYTEKARDLHLY